MCKRQIVVAALAVCMSSPAMAQEQGANTAVSLDAAPAQPAAIALPDDLPTDVRAYAQLQPQAVQRHVLMRTETASQYGLAQQARQRGDNREASFWLDQLRTSALIAKQSPVPGADAFGDRWLMQADLLNVRYLPTDLDSRQRQATFRLERFIQEQQNSNLPPSDTRRAALRDAQLVLLGLYDQRGQSKQAQELYQRLRGEHADLAPALHEAFGYLERLQQPVDELSLRTERGEPWSLQGQRGNVVLIHFWSDWYEPSEFMFDAIRQVYQSYRDQRIAMLSVNVGGISGGVAGRAAWPTVRMNFQDAGAYRAWGVCSLPRLMLIDAQGRLVAVSSSTAVLEQIGPLVVEAHAAAGRQEAPTR